MTKKSMIVNKILFGGMLMLVLTSCKKTWTCDCDAVYVNIYGEANTIEQNLSIEGNRIYDSKAKEQCKNFQTIISSDSISYSCKLKR